MMHIEIQVALNFVISYLYNKLPRRRVNIFGEELEKALKDKFQDHWYPEKPFKGSAYRCLKTGDPIDSVLDRAARESGVPITDILENLPNELSLWVDPGEVSYRIGEKGAVKILFSENSDNQEDNTSADCEVNKTFNPEAQCFRPIDAMNSSMNNLSLSPKASPQAGSSPHSVASSSPTYKSSPNLNPVPLPLPVPNTNPNPNPTQLPHSNLHPNVHPNPHPNPPPNQHSNPHQNPVAAAVIAAVATAPTVVAIAAQPAVPPTAAPYMQRSQAPLTFTTATFAQTKFGSTKLKTNSKRANSSYRMSPTEFSNYIKQRAMQQQLHHSHGPAAPQANQFGSIGPVSPARSLSPNPISLGMNQADPFYFPNAMTAMSIYPQFNGPRNIYEAHFHSEGNGIYAPTAGNPKFNGSYLDTHGAFYGIGAHLQQPPLPPTPQMAVLAPTVTTPIAGAQPSQQQQPQSQSPASPPAANVNILTNSVGVGTTGAAMDAGATKDVSVNTILAAAADANSNTAATNTISVTTSAVNTDPMLDADLAATLTPTSAASTGSTASNASSTASATPITHSSSNQDSSNASKIIDGLNPFYSNATSGSSYQQLLVAN